jgi:hypothetical protein
VASQAQAYQRSPLEPLPAERTSQRRLSFSSVLTASAQVIFVPAANVIMKFDGTRSTYAWRSASKCSRSWVQFTVDLVPAGLDCTAAGDRGYGTGVGVSAAAVTADGIHSFPAVLTSFVGRDGPVREVAGLLEEHRLVTVAGPGVRGRPG